MLSLRNNDFITQCDDYVDLITSQGNTPDIRQIADHVIHHGNARYYVEPDNAMRMYRLMTRDGDLPRPTTLRQAMWHEIFTKVRKLLRRYPRMVLADAMTKVLANGKASRFFIALPTALDIIRKHAKTIKTQSIDNLSEPSKK